MAKRLSTAEALRIDRGALDKLNRAELAKVVQTLSDTANKRLQRLERLNAKVPSYVSATRKNERFTTRGKNLNELREEYARATRFLTGKSTVSDAKQTKAKTEKILNKSMNFKELSDFWKKFAYLTEKLPGLSYALNGGSEKVAQWLSEIMTEKTDLTSEELFEKANELYQFESEELPEDVTDEDAFGGYYSL